MAIISFWSEGLTETGKTTSMAGIATFLSIENNYKILLFNTKHNDTTMEECFWEPEKKSMFSFMTKNKVDIDTGIVGLTKAILSNKTSPEIITNYTKTIFKNRLELLTDKNVLDEDYIKQRQIFKDIVKSANKYYDFVFVDLDGDLEDITTTEILENSDLIVLTGTQKTKIIDEYEELKRDNNVVKKEKSIILLGRFDKNSKYTVKNISRYIGDKEVYAIPYNTLFFEACNEGKITEFFTKFRKNNPTDRNSQFVQSINNISNRMIEKIKELQMKMY